jgi:hypothetical protein
MQNMQKPVARDRVAYFCIFCIQVLQGGIQRVLVGGIYACSFALVQYARSHLVNFSWPTTAPLFFVPPADIAVPLK